MMRPLLIQAGRSNLKQMLTPLFATAERRQAVSDQVDAIPDEKIEEVWRNYGEAMSHECPECGRPYEQEEV